MSIFSNFVLVFYLLKNVPLIYHNACSDSEETLKERKKNPPGCFKMSMIKIFKFLKFTYALTQASDVIYYVAYGVMALLGIFSHPFFFTFHLTEIMMRYPSLKNVLKSVYEPRE
mmetsp:Transcript_1425/g.217  ORF Transcript_1425/g.217 Transcript_1425/m.217 type:complete len:114 (+) Transcript_1425:99-440(+)